MVMLDVRVGAPLVRGALTLFPLLAPPGGSAGAGPSAGVAGAESGDASEYLAGPAAFADGSIEVTEQDEGAMVSQLKVVSRSKLPVLLVEGENILGAKQNRTLNVSVLVAAGGNADVPVSCVEAGRWGAPKVSRQSERHSPSTVRRYKTRSVNQSARLSRGKVSDQGRVWSDVAALDARFDVGSRSQSLDDVFASTAADIAEMVDGVEVLDDQVGVVVAVGGRIEAIDVFDRPDTLAAFWQGLLNGYALDSLDLAPQGEVLAEEVEAFLAEVAASDVAREPGVGLGTDLFLAGDTVTGVALEWNGVIRHLAAFRLDPSDEHGPTNHRCRWRRPLR